MAVTPTLDQIIQAGVDSGMAEIYTALPVKVQSFDSGNNTVDVIPMVRSPIERLDGSTLNEDLPVIPAVPVQWMQTNRFSFTFPIQPGDFGLILVQTFSDSSFLDTGAVSNPGDVRRNHIANCRFLPGYGPKSSKPQYAGDPDVVIEPGASMIRLGGGAANFAADASKVATELGKISAALSALIAPAGGGTCTGNTYTAPGSVACTKVKVL